LEHQSSYEARISLLWVLQGLTYLAYLGFTMIAPGVIDQVRSGTIEGTDVQSAGSLFAVLFFVVILMAFLSLNLKYATNRRANIGVGAVIAIVEFIGMISSLSSIFAPVLVTWVAKVAIAASIVWFAYKWPKPTA
jgi:uncharacterized membrane protein